MKYRQNVSTAAISSLFLICLMLMVTLIVPPGVSAQVPVSLGKLEIGLKGGLSWSNFDNTVLHEQTSRISRFTAGAYVRIPISSVISFQPEIAYVSKGAKFPVNLYLEEAPIVYDVADYKFRLDYVEVSPLLRLSPKIVGPVQPSLVLGPCFGFNVLSKSYLLESDWNITNASALTVGIELGTIVQLNMVRPIFVDVRYSLGLTEAYDVGDYLPWNPLQFPVTEYTVNEDVKNDVVSIAIGIVIF